MKRMNERTYTGKSTKKTDERTLLVLPLIDKALTFRKIKRSSKPVSHCQTLFSKCLYILWKGIPNRNN